MNPRGQGACRAALVERGGAVTAADGAWAFTEAKVPRLEELLAALGQGQEVGYSCGSVPRSG